MILGEYWITEHNVEYADGDDRNHEMIALDYIAGHYLQDIYNLNKNLKLVYKRYISFEETPYESIIYLIKSLENYFENKNLRDSEILNIISKESNVPSEVLALIRNTNSDPREFVMKNYGWIAVRANNVELFDYRSKIKKLIDGLDEILEEEEEDDDDKIELSIFDIKTKKSFIATLSDIKNNSLRPYQLPNTTYNIPLIIKKNKGNLPSKMIDAKTKSLMNTSESVHFKTWLLENSQIIVRRNWFDFSNKEQRDCLSCCKAKKDQNR